MIFVPDWPKGEFVSLWLATFYWTKSLLCNVATYLGIPFISESSFQKCASQSLKKILCSFQVRRNRIPTSCPDGPVMRPDAHQCLLFKLAYVRTFQQHVRTLFKVRAKSSVQVHPSGGRGCTIRTLVSVRQVKGFPSQTQIWEDSCNRRTSGLRRLDAIHIKAKCGEELQPSGHQGNTVRTPVLIMKISCSKMQLSGC